jgi:hypothetical protein
METIMKIIYDTVDGVDVEKQIYTICQVCFDDMLLTSQFILVIPGLLMDQIETNYYYYVLDTSVECDSLDQNLDLESICTIKAIKI